MSLSPSGSARQLRRLAHQRAYVSDCGGALDRRLERAGAAQPLDVPRVELAQVPRRPFGAKVLDRAVDYPVELGQDLVRRRLAQPGSEHLLEEPRVPERSAREQDAGGAGLLERRLDPLGAVEA